MVLITEREGAESWLKRNVPKQTGKFRPDIAALKNPPAELGGKLHDPAVLNTLRSVKEPIGLVNDSGSTMSALPLTGDEGKVIMLSRHTMPGKGTGWWGIPSCEVVDLYRELLCPLFVWLLPLVVPGHIDAWERIVAGLGMEDTAQGKQLVDSVRTLLTERRNPIRQPYKLART